MIVTYHIAEEKIYRVETAELQELAKAGAYAPVILFDHIPIAQQRPRTRIQGIHPKTGKPLPGKKIFAQIYMTTANQKNKLDPLIPVIPYPEDEALFLYGLALYRPPQSRRKEIGQKKLTKPDGTNILKFYEDLMEKKIFPSDQCLNPSFVERYYWSYDAMIIGIVRASERIHIPRIIKSHFMPKQTLL